jgi:hypothetical protein
MEKVQVISLALSIVLFWVVLRLIHRRYLREQYSLLWLLFGVVMFGLSLNTKWLKQLAAIVGIYYAPSLLFLVGIILCLLLILHLTVVVSKLTERVVRLTQELSLLRNEK